MVITVALQRQHAQPLKQVTLMPGQDHLLETAQYPPVGHLKARRHYRKQIYGMWEVIFLEQFYWCYSIDAFDKLLMSFTFSLSTK